MCVSYEQSICHLTQNPSTTTTTNIQGHGSDRFFSISGYSQVYFLPIFFFFEKPFNRKLIRLFYSDLFANWQKTWSAGEWEKKKEIINLIRNRNWIWIMKNSFAKKENLSKIPITHYWKEKTSKVFWYFNLFGTKKFDILNSTQRKKELQGVYVCQ